MSSEIIQRILKNLHLGGEIVSKTKTKYTKCPKCDYTFKDYKISKFLICDDDKCVFEYSQMKLKKKNKMKKRYKNNPSQCPICKNPFKNITSKPKIFLCKNCGYVAPLQALVKP